MTEIPDRRARMGELDSEMARLQSEGVPEDDPALLEAWEEYTALGAEIALGADSVIFLTAGPGDRSALIISAPEAH